MKERMKRWVKYQMKILYPASEFFVDMVFVVSSLFLAADMFFGLSIDTDGTFIKNIGYLWIVSLLFKTLLFFANRITLKKFRKVEMAEKLSAAMLNVYHRANAYKTRHVLQITYGSVPDWHPFDFYENVLPYDVHEQIRTILLELKSAILSVAPELDTDAVTVDLVYCYPNDANGYGKIPADKDEADDWRLITSGDGSPINYKVHDFLSNEESFYSYLNQNNYVFFNDKLKKRPFKKEELHYIASGKDREYEGAGSIVGLTLNVKNDEPEKVLVKAMITITTYGRKLNERGDPVEERDYRELLKKNILNGCKALLESELAQMYVRHMIREGDMCPRTGKVAGSDQRRENEEPAGIT